MKKLITAVFISVFLVAPVYAGGGHEHSHDGGHSHGPVSVDEVMKKADKKVKALIKAGKVDKSWAGNKASAEKKRFKNAEEWVVSYNNAAMKDEGKRTLYLFFSLNGRYIAANYTGN